MRHTICCFDRTRVRMRARAIRSSFRKRADAAAYRPVVSISAPRSFALIRKSRTHTPNCLYPHTNTHELVLCMRIAGISIVSISMPPSTAAAAATAKTTLRRQRRQSIISLSLCSFELHRDRRDASAHKHLLVNTAKRLQRRSPLVLSASIIKL